MWRSIFLHEFIDDRIKNFKAVAGNATLSPPALKSELDTVTGVNSVRITPGRGFEYKLEKGISSLIGFSCRVRLAYRFGSDPGHPVPIIRLGNAVELRLQSMYPPQAGPGGDASGFPSFAELLINSHVVDFWEMWIPRAFTEVRADWHTSGQARLSLNGQLIAYSNNAAPGALLDFDSVVLGLPGPASSATSPEYLVSRVFIRTLQRADSLVLFSRLLPTIKLAGEDTERCQLRAIENIMKMTDRLRAFMAKFHQSQSQPWSALGGAAGGPFSEDAKKAHALALEAGLALAKMLRAGDLSAPEAFLDPFTEFLRIVRKSQPAQFNALAEELRATRVVPEDCRELINKTVENNMRVFKPLLTLFSAAEQRLRDVEGGN